MARGIWQAYFRTHDAFLMPTALVPAFPHDQSGNQLHPRADTPGGPRPYGDLCFWISFATLAGLPATTAPVGLTAGGLPVGLQIVGRIRGRDAAHGGRPAGRRDRRLQGAAGLLTARY